MQIRLIMLTVLATTLLQAESWQDYRPGFGPKGAQVEFTMAGNDTLQMQFLPGNITNGQAWGSRKFPFPGVGRKIKMSLMARVENVSDPKAWVQIGFQGEDAAGKQIAVNDLIRIPAEKLKDWTLLEHQFEIPKTPDSKWNGAKTLVVGFSGRTTGAGLFQFKDIQYRELPANVVFLRNYRPGQGPKGVKSEVSVIDDQVIQVKYLPGNVPNAHSWFNREYPKPAPGKTVILKVSAKVSQVMDPKAYVQLSIQGNDAAGKNIQAYLLKKISAFDLEEWETLSHSFTIPAGDPKWDRAATVMCGFSAVGTDGIFQFKDFSIDIK